MRHAFGTASWVATLAMAASAATLAPAHGATIRVPADQPTIAAALALAGAGDTVLVSPGVYAERLEHASGAVLRAAGGAGSVVVDGGGAGAVIECRSPVPGTAVEGLVLRGGSGQPDGEIRIGGAVVVHGGSLRLADVRIEGSSADLGGGLFCDGARVTWTGGALVSNAGDIGGGWFASGGSLLLHGVEVAGNTARLGGGGYGSGLAPLEMVSCVCRDNTALEDGGGLWLAGTGAAINDSRIVSNGAGGRGGGLRLGPGSLATLSYSVFAGNTAGAAGGGLDVTCDGPAGPPCAEARLFHVDLAANRAPQSGAAAVSGAARIAVEASLVARNEGGLACLSSQATLDLSCSVIFSNEVSPTRTDCEPVYADTLETDPRLCDLPALDLLRCANSPLLSPPACGLPYLGALGAGCGPCGPTPVAFVTWGHLKARYR
jgi:hypothetical protein